jgi:SAM-dependent methyltransferase
MSPASGGNARQVISGSQYVRQITALRSDRRARSAFQNLVLRIAPPGGTLLDFGSGPGMDARFYAESGLNVAAYDVDPQMRDFFASHCQNFIQAGRIAAGSGEYRDFLACKNVGGFRDFDLVTSNFAPLNLIENLHELFAKFHALTDRHGKVLASVLSPYYFGDMKYLWWWRNALRLWRDGYYSIPGAQARIFRRHIGNFALQAAPYFALNQVFLGPGPAASGTQSAEGVDVSDGAVRASLLAGKNRFMFLLFEKR